MATNEWDYRVKELEVARDVTVAIIDTHKLGSAMAAEVFSVCIQFVREAADKPPPPPEEPDVASSDDLPW